MLTIAKNTAYTYSVNLGVSGITPTIMAAYNGSALSGISPTVIDRNDGTYSVALTPAMTNYNNIFHKITGSGVITQEIMISTYDLTTPVTVSGIQANVITAASIQDGAITNAKATSVGVASSVTGAVGSVTSPVSVSGISAGVITESVFANDAISDAKVKSDVTIASITGNIGGNLAGSVGSVVGSVGSVTAPVTAASVTAPVTVGTIGTNAIIETSFRAGAIDAAAIAPNAIGASELATDAITEIQAGLATASQVSGIAISIDDIPTNTELNARTILSNTYATATQASGIATQVSDISTTLSGVPTVAQMNARTLPTGNYATASQVSGITVSVDYAAIASGVLSELLTGYSTPDSLGKAIVDILAKTGQLTFTTANKVDASVSAIGPGRTTKPYPVTDSTNGNPIPNVYVKVTSNVDGTGFITHGYTNTQGIAYFNLDAGTYYMWRTHPNFSFSDPDLETF